jgi:hypothetical protein
MDHFETFLRGTTLEMQLLSTFTRYDLPAHEPETLQREWSPMNVLNQKGTRRQDKPTHFSQLSDENRRLTLARYPELKSLP